MCFFINSKAFSLCIPAIVNIISTYATRSHLVVMDPISMPSVYIIVETPIPKAKLSGIGKL